MMKINGYWKDKKRPDISLKLKGHKVSEETRKKIKNTLIIKGIKPLQRFDITGKKRSENYIKRKKEKWLLKHPPIIKECLICQKKFKIPPIREKTAKYCSIVCANKGLENKNAPLVKRIRGCFKSRQWRSDIFTRDDYTCQICETRGGRLEANHIKAFSSILYENKIKTLEEALNCEELWNINNGQTLCQNCHKKTENYGRK